MKHHKSVFQNEQDLLKALLDIHNNGNDIDLDPMFFKGNFYKDGVNIPKYIFDINPQLDNVVKGDATNIDLPSETMNCIILDPPFLIGNRPSQKQYYSAKTHTMFPTFNDLENMYKGILSEAHRLLKNKGITIFKCQDYTDSKTIMTHIKVANWAEQQGFYIKDIAILVKPNKVYNGNTQQRHLRKIHTYFYVFEKRRVLV